MKGRRIHSDATILVINTLKAEVFVVGGCGLQKVEAIVLAALQEQERNKVKGESQERGHERP